MPILICPVCKGPLMPGQNTYHCDKGHSFDIAKEHYVNLLSGHAKPGTDTGDNRDMARSRHAFLDKGFYSPIADAVSDISGDRNGMNVLDICCGEGYYTARLAEKHPENSYFGFDLSREMVRLAAKRKTGAEFFVANISSIPMADGSVDFAFHLFAPFHAPEFSRILHEGGTLVTAVPGKDHLMGLKRILYDTPYENDESFEVPEGFRLCDTVRVKYVMELCSAEDISALLKMTPYCYHTPSAGLARLAGCDSLMTDVDILLAVYKKERPL